MTPITAVMLRRDSLDRSRRTGRVEPQPDGTPALRGSLASISKQLGDWVGEDEEVEPRLSSGPRHRVSQQGLQKPEAAGISSSRSGSITSAKGTTCGTHPRSAFRPAAGPRSNPQTRVLTMPRTGAVEAGHSTGLRAR